MRILFTLLFAIFAISARAVEWRNDLFGCTANLPDSTGWQTIEAPSTPAITMLVAMQHPQRQAVFGINVLHNLPTKKLNDDANIAAIEQLLKGMGFQPIGHSIVMVAGRGWLQFPVRGSNAGQPVTGLVRYTLSDEHVFGISMMVGGGKEASQDTELQSAAASFRIIGRGAVAAANPAGGPAAPAGSPAVPGAAAKPPATPAEAPASAEPEMIAGLPAKYVHIGLIILGVLVVILIFSKIIGGGGGSPPAQPPQRRL